jgi:TolB-like protein/class 3 adenylate cyclase
MAEPLPRKLLAILYADVAEYSRLTGDDEDATHRILSEYLDLVTQTIESQRGQVIHYAGDAVLARFDAVVDAVSAAVAVQNELNIRNESLPDERKLQFRIGVNLGDVIEDRGDIYGDGVNVAARLESIADPGGVCISTSVFEQINGKLNLQFENMGERKLKNIAETINAYRILHKRVEFTSETFEKLTGERIELPDKPSIAVLPFQNMSGDPEQEYFADGMSEDIITVLSNLSDLVVIARNSTFVYKGRAVDVREVGRNLGVGFVLEGSVRKSGERLRITAQLVDGRSGDHIWAERYDRTIEDIFAIQDEITREIAVALSVNIGYGENYRIWTERAANFEVWQLFQRAMNHYLLFTAEGNETARHLCRQVVEMDPKFDMARVLLGWALQVGARYGFISDPVAAAIEAEALVREALAKDKNNGDALALLGFILINPAKYDEAIAHGQRAIECGPNVASNHGALAISLHYAGEHAASLTRMKKAIRLGPYPQIWILAFLGEAYRSLGELERARLVFENLALRAPGSPISLIRLAMIYSDLDQSQKARQAADDLMSCIPVFSVGRFVRKIPYKLQSDRESLSAALLKAGLPE